jgi:predicted nucleic acid-binding protein
MNGLTDSRFVLDSCTCINFLNERIPSLPLGDLFISVITEMEVLAKRHITPEEEQEVIGFFKGVSIVPLSDAVKCEAIRIRREASPRLKLPDAIVAAAAVVLDAQLITADEKLRKLLWPGFNAALPSA